MSRQKRDQRVKPEAIGKVVSQYLDKKGLTRRIQQASTIEDWGRVVGPQIAKVTEALSITPDGTLFVAVTTNGWMTELSLMEPELIRSLNADARARRVRKIRFQLKR
jgi:predicted nucleic acid-binding Zn ribbon protein